MCPRNVQYLSLLVQGDRFLCEHCYQLTAQTMAQTMVAASTATTMAVGSAPTPTPTAKTETAKYGKAEFFSKMYEIWCGHMNVANVYSVS